MSINGFKLIREHTFECETCGEEVPSGIINISGHWAECSGKKTMELIKENGISEVYKMVIDNSLKFHSLNK